MKNNQIGGLEYYSFEQFGFSKIPHGFFTRNGGISPKPFNSLNLSTTGGDSRENVVENRQRIFTALKRPVESLYDAWQVHGNRIIQVDAPRGLDNAPQKADGLVTGKSDITLFMRFADCVPILLYDPVQKVAGIFHAGWKGTLSKIVVKAIRKFTLSFLSQPGDIIAGIGPCICADHYQIKEDVSSKVEIVFKTETNRVLKNISGEIHFDLGKANEILLRQAGVRKIENSNICTACNTANWFSHRVENGSTGRFGAYIALA